jgi:hypothetical protein
LKGEREGVGYLEDTIEVETEQETMGRRGLAGVFNYFGDDLELGEHG